MESTPPRSVAIWGTPVALAALLLAGAPQLRAEHSVGSPAQIAGRSDARWARVSVEFPTSVALFPAGEGALIANSQCLMCHSADMILRQPARTQEQWNATIKKMRTAYGAPLPIEQIDPLAAYLARSIPGNNAGSHIEHSNQATAAEDGDQRTLADVQQKPKTASAAMPAADGAAILAARCAYPCCFVSIALPIRPLTESSQPPPSARIRSTLARSCKVSRLSASSWFCRTAVCEMTTVR